MENAKSARLCKKCRFNVTEAKATSKRLNAISMEQQIIVNGIAILWVVRNTKIANCGSIVNNKNVEIIEICRIYFRVEGVRYHQHRRHQEIMYKTNESRKTKQRELSDPTHLFVNISKVTVVYAQRFHKNPYDKEQNI